MSLRFAVNCSILFTELPLYERPAAARAAGFEEVEFWWPFASAVPEDGEVDRFVTALADAGVRLIGLNFAAGDMAAGDRGLVSWPARSLEFRDNLAAVLGIAEMTGCRAFNALYGNRLDGVHPAAQDEIAIENLALAAAALRSIDGTVLVEPLSGADRYPLLTAADVVDVITNVERTGVTNLALLADLYHLTVNGDDVGKVISTYGDRIAHVQLADAPGRNEPGSGTVPFDQHLNELAAAGYRGRIALEYKPSTASTLASLTWLR
ncbi:hydroxypyruvate isomerase family protein [Kribbella deserti]|uniref:Hydroxypyruvate isomerase family protein n=1 Tax=Kribbella deserti TaxID=1926257 RepID=A0ABV6QD29_9ACTN